jgi:hypothetical protein
MATSPLDSAIQSQRSEKKSKRGILYTALLGVAGLGAASSVFAASITVDNAEDNVINFAQANSTISGCDDSFSVALGSMFSSGSFSVDTITLGAAGSASTLLATDCGGKALTLNFYNSSNTLLGSVTGTLPTSGELSGGIEIIGTNDSALVTGAASSASSNTYTVTYETVSSVLQDAETLASNATRTTVEIN